MFFTVAGLSGRRAGTLKNTQSTPPPTMKLSNWSLVSRALTVKNTFAKKEEQIPA